VDSVSVDFIRTTWLTVVYRVLHNIYKWNESDIGVGCICDVTDVIWVLLLGSHLKLEELCYITDCKLWNDWCIFT